MAERAAVFGKDERTKLPARLRGLKNQIGLLYEPNNRSICTAFCVAPDIVATAAHCLFPVTGERAVPLSKVWFRLGLDNRRGETRIAGADKGAAAQNIMAGSMRLSVRPPIDADRDWALVRLARPACGTGSLKLSGLTIHEIAEASKKRPIRQVAFHQDFRNWELALSSCELTPWSAAADAASITRDFINADGLMLHKCDSGGASSGSPLLLEGPAGIEVVGVNVGTYVQSKVLMQDQEVVRRFKPDEVANTGVSVAQIAPRLELFARAKVIEDRAAMRDLQVRLEAAGFPSGRRDGFYGPDLRAAIEAYERTHRLAVTGLPTVALAKRLGRSAPIGFSRASGDLR